MNKQMGKKERKKESIMVPVRLTGEQEKYLARFVSSGMFSSRQEAIRFFISEKMIKEKES